MGEWWKHCFGVAGYLIPLKFLDISWWRLQPTFCRDHKAVGHYCKNNTQSESHQFIKSLVEWMFSSSCFIFCCLVLSEVCNLHDGNWPTWLNLWEGDGGGKEPPNLISLWSQKVTINNNIKTVFLKVFFLLHMFFTLNCCCCSTQYTTFVQQ